MPTPTRINRGYLPPDFPHEELARRIADDAELKRLEVVLERTSNAYQKHLDVLEVWLEQCRNRFDSSETATRARVNHETALAKISTRKKEITNKLKREYWTFKDRAIEKAAQTPAQRAAADRLRAAAEKYRADKKAEKKQQQTTTPSPPTNEAHQGQSNGSLEDPHLDGTRRPDADNKVPEQG